MRLLIATGGAPHSNLAVRLGAYLAHTTGKAPTILTVIRHESDRPHGEAVLARTRLLLEASVAEVRTRLRVGHPAEEIVAEAVAGRYDIILLGDKHAHDLVTRLLGSTVKKVLEQAPCPVIIAKGKVGPVRRILLCDSGAESVSLLDRFTTRLASLARDPGITVLHVMSQISAGPGVVGRQLRADAEELMREHTPEGTLLERDVQILERLNLHPDTKVRHGFVVTEIINEARAGDYDLIVIGAHRGKGWQRFLLEDLAFQIIMHADRPVLVLR